MWFAERMTRLLVYVASSTLVALAFACGGSPMGSDSGSPDGSVAVRDASPDATSDASTDVGSPDAASDASTDTGSPDAGGGLVPVFVAQGHVGRTAVSCDGRRWVADRSLDDTAVCWPETGDYDCDHHPGAAKGLVYGRGYWFATWGWGEPGGIDRSADGIAWERVLPDTQFGGLAFGDGVLVAGARNARRSATAGDTWEDTGDTGLAVWNVRRAGYGEGAFVMVGEDGSERDVVVSRDGGATWQSPAAPDACGANVQTRGGIVGGGGVILVLGGDGTACTSTDGGATFEAHAVGGEITSQVVWNGDMFVAWGSGMRYASEDGTTWNATPTTPSDVSIGAVAYHPDLGVYVGVRGGWQVWYDRQVFYRSTDGVVWVEADDFQGGHPIRFLEAGYLDRCPD